MRKIANTNELQSELRRLIAYSQSKRPSRGKISIRLSDLSKRLAASYNSYGERVEKLQIEFLGEVVTQLYETLGEIHRKNAEDFTQVFGFLNWDYGSAKRDGSGWSIRLWLKDGSVFQNKKGREIEGNLLLSVGFDSKIGVQVEMGNTTEIFSKSYDAKATKPWDITWGIAGAWTKLLHGS